MDLAELIAGLHVSRSTPSTELVRICDITEDSRTVMPGSLFVARKGHKADGKRFVEDAALAGAAAVLTDDETLESPKGYRIPILFSSDVPSVCAMIAERYYGKPTQRLKVSGVTGTNGKSTTTYLIWQLMNRAKHRCGLIGTVIVDDGSEVAESNMTTPPAIELSRSLGIMVEAGCVAATLEVSSHALDQKRVDGLKIDVGVYTNLTGDHLDYHKTMEHYAASKARLFEMLPPDGTAIINEDDEFAARMVQGCKCAVLRCALNAAPNEADPAQPGECRATVLEASITGMALAMEGPWGVIEATVPLIGRFNAMNVLQAVAACYAKGLSREQICQGLPALCAPPGRLQRVNKDTDDISVFVDYAHSDDSLRNCLESVAALIPGRSHAGALLRSSAGSARPTTLPLRHDRAPTGKLWVVFGCGGDKDKTKRPRMGAVAIEIADQVVVTSDNPRTEKPSAIVDDILVGISKDLRDKLTVQVDRERAIRHAIESAQTGDVVIIAGKGHEKVQIVSDGAGGTLSVHFDDSEIAQSCLEARRRNRES